MAVGEEVARLENELDEKKTLITRLQVEKATLLNETAALKTTNHGLLQKHLGYKEAVQDILPFLKGALEVYRE